MWKIKLLVLGTAVSLLFFVFSGETSAQTAPAIMVLSPNGGEILLKGSSHTVGWASVGVSESLFIDLVNEGGFAVYFVASNVPNTGSYSWAIPDSVAEGSYRLRVTTKDGSIKDESDAPFRIIGTPTITVLSPNGGEKWEVGKTYDIKWCGTSSFPAGNSRVLILKGGVTRLELLQSSGMALCPGATAMSWTVPSSLVAGDDYTVRVEWVESATGTASINDVSNAPFSITPAIVPSGPAVTVLSPNGGEQWSVGQEARITWKRNWMPEQANGLADVYYKRGNGQGTFMAGGANDAYGFTWIVPSWLAQADDYKIVVVSRGFGGSSSQPLSDQSDAPFRVAVSPTAQPFIKLLSPNGGEKWAPGETRDVRWCAESELGQGISTVWLSRKSGLPIREGVTALRLEQAKGILLCSSGATTFPWYMPSDMLAADDYQIEVRFERVGGALVAQDTSDAAFRISSSGAISDQPTKPELFIAHQNGRTVTINGFVYGAAGPMRWLWGDGAEEDSYFPATHTYSQDGRYTVTVSASNAAGKTQATIEATASGASVSPEPPQPIFEQPFTGVASAVGVTSPRGGEQWEKGKSYAISWIQQGVTYVNLSLFKDEKFVQYIERDLPVHKNLPQTSIQWTVPFNLASGSGYRIYVVAPLEGAMTSASNVFGIAGAESAAACLPDGTLIKMPDDQKVYVIEKCQKRWVQSAEEFQTKGYEWDNVKPVEPTVAQAYAEYLQAQAKLLRAIGGDGKVYEVVSGKRLWIPSADDFQAQGFQWQDVGQASAGEVNKYPLANLVRGTGDNRIYYVTESGLKRHIINPETFLSYGNKWEDVVEVSPSKLGLYADNALIKRSGDVKVYKLENGKKRWVPSAEAFERYQFDWRKVAPVNDTEFNAYSEAAPLG